MQALFEVTPSSYHQVDEVTVPKDLKDSVYRLSISGWFHGPLRSRLALRGFIKPAPSSTNQALANFINPTYLLPEKQAELAEHMSEHSSLVMNDFLLDSVFDQVKTEIDEAEWSKSIGPASVRRYRVLPSSITGSMIQPPYCASEYWGNLQQLFGTTEFYQWLANITNLPVANSSRVHFRYFQRGCYTLVHDHGQDPLGLDVTLCFGNATREPWSEEWGGKQSYTAAAVAGDGSEAGESEAGDGQLFSVPVVANSLSIAYRDAGVLKAVGYVNGDAQGGRLDLEAVYILPQDDNAE